METLFYSYLAGVANAHGEPVIFLFGVVTLRCPCPESAPVLEVTLNGLDASEALLESGEESGSQSAVGDVVVKENEKVVSDVLYSCHLDVWVDWHSADAHGRDNPSACHRLSILEVVGAWYLVVYDPLLVPSYACLPPFVEVARALCAQPATSLFEPLSFHVPLLPSGPSLLVPPFAFSCVLPVFRGQTHLLQRIQPECQGLWPFCSAPPSWQQQARECRRP